MPEASEHHQSYEIKRKIEFNWAFEIWIKSWGPQCIFKRYLENIFVYYEKCWINSWKRKYMKLEMLLQKEFHPIALRGHWTFRIGRKKSWDSLLSHEWWQKVKTTDKSLSEALIFASTNPQYDDRLFIQLQVQYMKIPSSNLRRTYCVQKLLLTFRTISVHNIFSPCSEKRRTSDKDLPVPKNKFWDIQWFVQNVGKNSWNINWQRNTMYCVLLLSYKFLNNVKEF